MEYLSASRIHLFNQCPLSFKLKYMDSVGMEDDTTEFYADYGTLVHDILEDIAKGNLPLLDQAFRKFDERFPSCKIPDKIRPEYYKQGKEGIARKFEELGKLDIVGAEIEFKVYIDFALPPLRGFVDLVYRDEKGRLITRDYKTSKVYGKSELDKQFQKYIYSIAVKHLFGEYPFRFEYDFVRFGESKDFIVTDKFISMGELKIKTAWRKIKASNFPAKYSPFFCENFCENRTLCPIFMKKNGY